MNHGKFKTISITITSLMILAASIWGSWKLLQLLWIAFSRINPTLGAGIVAASATIIVSIASILLAKHQERKVLVQNDIRSKKTPVYEEMVKFIFSINFAQQLGKPQPTEKEMIEKMAWFTENLVIWGSDDLVKTWLNFRLSNTTGENPGFDVLFKVEELLMAIRKDLGHKNDGFKKGTILGLFVNDLHKII